MISASLYDFLLFGNLGPLTCQLSEHDVNQVIGLPDDEINAPIHHAFYGCIQIQYAPSKQIAVLSVLLEDPAFPTAGPIELNPWRFRRGMSVYQIADLLKRESIRFTDTGIIDELPYFVVNGVTQIRFIRSSSGETVIWHLCSIHPDFGEIMDDILRRGCTN